MAGIEQLEIHSKAYIVRWVKVNDSHTLSWSVQPHRKSIYFGVVKHPGAPGTGATTYGGTSTPIDGDSHGVHAFDLCDPKHGGRVPKKDTTTAEDLLASKGFIPIKWCGKLDADVVSMGTFDVPVDQSGMYGLVFDNTFSKQTSKTVTFVLLTYPTGAPPQANHHTSSARASHLNLRRSSTAKLNGSLDTVYSPLVGPLTRNNTAVAVPSELGSGPASPPSFHSGNLYKRRRKKGQGYACRFFSLDYSSCSLSYYHARTSSSLRGSIPLSLAAISADQNRKEITIDSGAEIWHLKAQSPKEFSEWARALENASRIARGLEAKPDGHTVDPADTAAVTDFDLDQRPSTSSHFRTLSQSANDSEDTEWHQVEALVSRVAGTRDSLRRVVNIHLKPHASVMSTPSSPAGLDEPDGYFAPLPHHRHFWKRKTSATTSPHVTRPAMSALSSSLAVPSTGSASSLTAAPGPFMPQRVGIAMSKPDLRLDGLVHEHCNTILRDLDSVLNSFTSLIANSKRRRLPPPPVRATPGTRMSMESTLSDVFFDAEAGRDEESHIVLINQGVDHVVSDVEDNKHDSDSESTVDEEAELPDAGALEDLRKLGPHRPKSLSPLPITEQVQRRRSVPAATGLPPSLIGLVRQNVGRDLSTISVPVSANEPISLLQRVAEQLEYAELLDQAAKESSATDRLLRVAAFAVSQFSGGRARERALRKPFNPLLGETFELVRTEHEVPGGLRVLVEKVCHRPVRLALQADASRWSLSQAPAPSQKFWGKSAEITTEGKVRLALRLASGADELYSWSMATMFLRNVVMGEKYVEPVGSMHVFNDNSGAKAVITFRSKGVFGGRSEDVTVDAFDPDGAKTGCGLTGTWTGSLRAVDSLRPTARPEIWRVGALVHDYARTFGFTAFAATLNEISVLERGRLPATDSRLRADQRLLEDGDLDQAERCKGRLEEAQRARRHDLEARGESHRPRWFVGAATTADGEEVWRLKTGKDGYWEERAHRAWTGVPDIFSL